MAEAATTVASTAVSATSATMTTMPATLPKSGGAAQPWVLAVAALAMAAGLAVRPIVSGASRRG